MGYAGWPLELMRDPANAVPQLVVRLSEPDPEIRRTAVEMLGFIGGHHVVEALGRALTDSDPGVRAEAARALGTTDDPAAMPALARAVARPDVDPGVDVAIRHALVRISALAGRDGARDQRARERAAAAGAADRGAFCGHAPCSCWADEVTVLSGTTSAHDDQTSRFRAGTDVVGGRTVSRLA